MAEIMESPEDKAKEVLKNRFLKTLCVNADAECKFDKEGNMSAKRTGCKNEKRNGSKYCQGCSDKYKKKPTQ